MATIGFISKEASESAFLSGDSYWHDLFDSLHTVQIFYADNIHGATDWTGVDVVVDRNSGSGAYNFSHIPTTIPTLFGNLGLPTHFGFGSSKGSSHQDYSWDPLNDPWESEVAAQANLLGSSAPMRYVRSTGFASGAYAGGFSDPASDSRATIAWRFTSGHARVFHGYTVSSGATQAYDDLLLASLDFALDDTDPTGGGGGTPTAPPAYVPPEPRHSWLPGVPQHPAVWDDEVPYTSWPPKSLYEAVLQREGGQPKVWQIPYPEGYPDPGSELGHQTGIGEQINS